MPYIKFGWDDSDVYLYGSEDDDGHVIICSQCLLDTGAYEKYDRLSYEYATKDALYYHLEQHKKAGHTVPESAMNALREDDWIS